MCASNSTRKFQTHDFWIRDCDFCRHRFAEIAASADHAKKIYSDDYFNGGGAGYTDYLSEGEILRRSGQRYAKILSKYTTPGKILDVGAAAGFVLQGFVENGWRGCGIEPNAAMARFARENLNLSVANATLETFASDERFDLVSMIQVVAHFYDVSAAFENARKLCADDGFLLIETWNCRSLTARVFGKNWHEYSPPSVLHFFTPRTIADFAQKFGFEKVAVGRPAKKISGAHAKSLLLHKLENSMLKRAVRLVPDNLDFPYPAEDLFWILLRKS